MHKLRQAEKRKKADQLLAGEMVGALSLAQNQAQQPPNPTAMPWPLLDKLMSLFRPQEMLDLVSREKSGCIPVWPNTPLGS